MLTPGLLGMARRAAGSLAFRGIVTLALLVIVFSHLDWSSIDEKVRTGHPTWGLLSVVAVAAALVVGALRWDRLLRASGIALPRRELYRIYATTCFANAFLPTSVGGDVARPLMVSRRGPLLVRAAVTVLLERLAALLALLLLAWTGTALEPDAVSTGALTALAVVSTGLVVVALLIAIGPSPVRRLVRAAVPTRFAGHLDEVAAVLSAFRRPGVVWPVLLLSTVFQALVTIQLVLLAKIIGVELPFGLAAVALALVTLATLLPISIGGFGVREGSYVVVLAGGGIGRTDAVLISLLSVLVLFLATLPGAVELVRAGFSPAALEGEG
ncbi:MAG: hypothetical protein JWO02_4365 [Solirubrobacterales bacterium]|nr:hypothetical protein [Solirubrobacterales bacterium]